MVCMERRLNARGAVIAAWVVMGLLLAGAAGFALFLLLPAGSNAGGNGTATDLPSVAVAPVASPTPPSGRTRVSGTLERVEGQALVVNAGSGELTRVLVRSGAPIGAFSETTTADIRPDEAVVVTVNRQADGRLVGTRVRLQPAAVPADIFGGPAPAGGSTTSPNVVAGTAAGLDANRLRVRQPSGERTFDVELLPSVRVTRFTPVAIADTRPGQRVTIEGERLVDGSVAALAVVIFDVR